MLLLRFVGESATISCALVGENIKKSIETEHLKFIWTQTSGSRTKPLNFDQYTGRILFTDLKLEDAGTYSCQVYSDYNPKVPLANVATRVVVQKRPNAVEPRLRVIQVGNSPNGRNPFVKCEIVQGFPTPYLKWRRQDGEPMSMRVIVNGGLMHIQDASASEFGVYECVGRNEAGEFVVMYDFESQKP